MDSPLPTNNNPDFLSGRGETGERHYSENFINNILQSTNHGVLSYVAIRKNGEVVDLEIRYANPIALEQLDWPAEKVVGNTYLTLIPDAKERGLWQRVIRVLETGAGEMHEVQSPTYPDRFFLAYFTPLDDGVTVTFVEISEQKKQARELQEKNEELKAQKEFSETILNTTLDIIMVYGKDLRILGFNKASEDFFNLKREDVIGKVYTEIFPASIGTQGFYDLERALKGEIIHNAFYRSPVTGRFYKNFLSPLRDSGGNIYAALVVAHDITEIYEASEKIEQANRELRKMNEELQSFAYVSSHDLQEPLRKIQGFSGRILSEQGKDFNDMTKDHFNRLIAASVRMQKLIDALLDYSKTNTSEKNFTVTDLNLVLKEVKISLQEALEEKQAVIEAADLPTLPVILHQFHQLLSNIISNALKYSKPDVAPVITIKAEKISAADFALLPDVKHSRFWKISIQDNGIGFEQQYAPKIFELFQRLHGKAEYSGTGIGLAICKKIVEHHNGYITASGEPGIGARFDIYLPG